MKYDIKNICKAEPIARKIAELPKRDDIADFAPAILDIMKGVHWRVWQVLDEQPGRFGYMDDRFYMLRQVRNHPTYSRQLLDGLVR